VLKVARKSRVANAMVAARRRQRFTEWLFLCQKVKTRINLSKKRFVDGKLIPNGCKCNEHFMMFEPLWNDGVEQYFKDIQKVTLCT
jgi:hypothetical protein